MEFYDNKDEEETEINEESLPTYAVCLDVVGHEMTHGVTAAEIPVSTNYGYNCMGAIDEGYADAFGCLIDLMKGGDSSWSIAEKRRTLRDIADPERSDVETRCPAHITSSLYLDPDPEKKGFWFWEKDDEKSKIAHRDSALVSHAAYLMYKYGVAVTPQIMTEEQLANLWYKSMSMGLYNDLNKINFNTVYYSVFKAAEHSQFNEEQKSIIVKAFLEEGIPYDAHGTIQGSVQIDPDFDFDVPPYIAKWTIYNDNGFSRTAQGDLSEIILPGLYTVEMELFSQGDNENDPEPLSQCVRYIGKHEVKKIKLPILMMKMIIFLCLQKAQAHCLER